MLHEVKLPIETRSRLLEAMQWQFRLLHWAASVGARLTEEQDWQADCYSWLTVQGVSDERASAVAAWALGSEQKRILRAFATDQPTSREEKQHWVRLRYREAKHLLKKPRGTFEKINYKTDDMPMWKCAARDFWLLFYDEFRSESGLSYRLFSRAGRRNYKAQQLLQDFLAANDRLCVCPICDETTFFSIIDRDTGPSIYTDIDHYLPKSHYPHLSIHPYNLVPLCHNCNSGSKTDKDPLNPADGARYSLSDIWLPYRHPGLRSRLLITISGDANPTDDHSLFHADAFVAPAPEKSPHNFEAITDVLKRIYNLPGRWDRRMDEIGEKLFRRIRDYMRFYRVNGVEDKALSHLNELLYIFDQEAAAREPYTIVMQWWLVHLINEEQSLDGKPLTEEIEAWSKQQNKRATKMRAHGEALRSLVRSNPPAMAADSEFGD